MVNFNPNSTLSWINKISERYNTDGDNTTLTQKEIDAAANDTSGVFNDQDLARLQSLKGGKGDSNGDQLVGQYELSRYFNDTSIDGTTVSSAGLDKPSAEADTQVMADLETLKNKDALDAINGDDDIIGTDELDELKTMSLDEIKEEYGEEDAQAVANWRDAYVRLDNTQLDENTKKAINAQSGGNHETITDVLFAMEDGDIGKEGDGKFDSDDVNDTATQLGAFIDGSGPSTGGLVEPEPQPAEEE